MEKNLIQIKTKLNEKNEIKKDRKNRLKERLAKAYVRLNTFVVIMIFGMNTVFASAQLPMCTFLDKIPYLLEPPT